MTALFELIEIYGRQPADKVPSDPQYLALCKENDGSNLFHSERGRVESLRRKLEKSLDVQLTRRSQAKSALKIFEHELAPNNNGEDKIVYELVHADWYKNWTQDQQRYFDDTVETLRKGLDYFLSFTQRNSVGGANPVNSFHRYFIESFGVDPHGSPNNELARGIDRALRSSKYKFRGFYFPEHEGDSRVVSEKLVEAIDRALVFIQIVQNDMFSKDFNDTENYCFDEYLRADAQQKRSIYIFADGAHPADMLPFVKASNRFNNWYDFVNNTDCVAFARTLNLALEAANVVSNHDLLKKRVIDKIWSFREALWEEVPADL